MCLSSNTRKKRLEHPLHVVQHHKERCNIGVFWVSAGAGNPTHQASSYDSQPTYVLPVRNAQGAIRTRLYLGDRWNQASESGGGSVGNASYVAESRACTAQQRMLELFFS